MEEIRKFLKDWPNVPSLGGRTFNELFRIDNIPIWYFIHFLFYPSMIPRYISPYPLDGKKVSLRKRVSMSLSSHLLRRALYLREKRKIRSLRNGTRTKNKILLLSYTNHILQGNRIFRIQYLLDELKKRSVKASPIFVDPLSQATHMRLAGHQSIYPYYSPSLEKESRSDARTIRKRFLALPKKEDMLIYRKKRIWVQMSIPFHFFFSEEMLTMTILYYRMFRVCIRDQGAQAMVVTGAESLFERCAIAASHAEGIHSIIIQHGFETKTHLVGELDYLERYFAMSGYERQSLKKNGFPDSFIEVPGPIIYDEMACCKTRRARRSGRILLAGSASVESNYLTKEMYFENISRLARAAKELGLGLDIKPHPRETNIDSYHALKSTLSYDSMHIHQNLSRERFYQMMSETDAFIQFGSTSAIEAMILGAPILTIRIVDYPDNIMLDHCDAAVKIGKDDDMKAAIVKTIKDSKTMKERRRRFIHHYIGNVDGKASARAAIILQKMVGS